MLCQTLFSYPPEIDEDRLIVRKGLISLSFTQSFVNALPVGHMLRSSNVVI